MKTVEVIRYGNVHFHAGCQECSFSAARNTKTEPLEKDVRNAVYKHVRQTGHSCWIESGSHTVYTLVETRREVR